MTRKREKFVVVFDEKDRRDFLTGFRKRKNERRKKAQEENKKKEEEKRRLQREEKRNALRKHVMEYENQLETEVEQDLDVNMLESITHDFGQHTVTVSTITDEDMGKDFSIHPAENEPKSRDSRVTSTAHGQTSKDKSHRKRLFRKKAQKRKIQAMSDKKSSKQKITRKGKRK